MTGHHDGWPTDGFASWIGRQYRAEDIITPALVARFLATVPGLPQGPADGHLPPCLHWCLAPAAEPAERLGRDGHPALGLHLPPVPLPRRMWAGGDIEFHAPLRTGDPVMRLSTIEKIERKQGRSGALAFVTVLHELSTPRGPALSERHHLVYREAAASGTSGPSPAGDVPAGPPARRVATDPVLLFRYSALTFNGHRIHYDHPYATGVEEYPGLVVHGPLMATLLAALGEETLGSLSRFSFRGRAPLFCGEEMMLFRQREGIGAALELRAGGDRRLVMTAEAG